MIAEPGCLSAILTNSKNEPNLFRNFSKSTVFPGTKFEAEFTWRIKFLNIVKSFWGNQYYGMAVEHISRKFE